MKPNISISTRNTRLAYAHVALFSLMLIMPVRILYMQTVLSNSQINLLMGGMFLAIVFLELPTGALADLVGKKVTVFTSYVVYAASMLTYVFASSLWWFVLAFGLQALSESLRSGAHGALVYDSLKQDGRENEFRRINAQLTTIVQIGFIIASVVGGALGTINLVIPFYGYSLLLLLAAATALLMQEPSIDTHTFTLKSYVRQNYEGFKHLFRSTAIAQLTILYALIGGISWTFQRSLRDMLFIHVGHEQLNIGLINGALRLFNIVVLVKATHWLSKRYPGVDVLILPLLLAVSLLPGPFADYWLSIPMVAGFMMASTGRFIVFAPYLQDRIDSKLRATAMSAANLLVSLVLALNLFLSSMLLQWTTVPVVMLVYGVITLVVVVPLSLKVKKTL